MWLAGTKKKNRQLITNIKISFVTLVCVCQEPQWRKYVNRFFFNWQGTILTSYLHHLPHCSQFQTALSREIRQMIILLRLISKQLRVNNHWCIHGKCKVTLFHLQDKKRLSRLRARTCSCRAHLMHRNFGWLVVFLSKHALIWPSAQLQLY